MYTTKSIRLHSKCLAILEMIQKINNRIEADKKWLQDWDRCGMLDMPKLMWKRWKGEDTLIRDEAIKARMLRYYANSMAGLCEDVVAECYPELETA